MNVWHALAVALCITVIACALLLALSIKAEPQPITCMPDEEMKEKVRTIMLQALDDGLRTHIAKTFSVWMASDIDQPHRATVGVRNGLRAYVSARAVVLKWNPPLC